MAVFSSVPGIGKKTAERLILELRDKVGDLGARRARRRPEAAAPTTTARCRWPGRRWSSWASASAEADKLLAEVEPDQPVEAIIRQALAGKAERSCEDGEGSG